jgi:hypothetical protein
MREGPIGIEIVRYHDGSTVLNVFNNGLVTMSEKVEYNGITMPEALVWLATMIRMGNVTPRKEG